MRTCTSNMLSFLSSIRLCMCTQSIELKSGCAKPCLTLTQCVRSRTDWPVITSMFRSERQSPNPKIVKGVLGHKTQLSQPMAEITVFKAVFIIFCTADGSCDMDKRRRPGFLYLITDRVQAHRPRSWICDSDRKFLSRSKDGPLCLMVWGVILNFFNLSFAPTWRKSFS
jgi:hypothetical protein